MLVREGFKNPRPGNFPLGGFPPPPGPPRTRIFRKVSGKKLTEKGGTPPPSTDDPFPKTEIFSPKTAIFAQKTPFLSQFFMDFFLTEKGGTPPPPRTVGSRKPNGKKLTEKGGTPPPPRKVSVPGVFEPFPYQLLPAISVTQMMAVMTLTMSLI